MSVAHKLEFEPLAHVLAAFSPASSALLEHRALLRRVDTKFVVPASQVGAIVGDLACDYALLAMPAALATYRSLYFDTPDLRCFHDHRRGRRIRSKVRIRHYVDRKASVLEVKTRKTELVSDKQRIDIGFEQVHLGARERMFLREHVPYADALRPQLWIDYRRITLLGLEIAERVTIDVDLATRSLEGTSRSLGEIAIIEVKQAALARSPILRVLAEAGLREGSSSKYIAAIARHEPTVRMNRLLPTLRRIA